MQDLRIEIGLLADKVEPKKLQPEDISKKCVNVLQNMESMKSKLTEIVAENAYQKKLVATDFAQLLRVCKRQNFNSKSQGTSTDSKFSNLENLSEQLGIPGSKYDLECLISSVQNPCLIFLAERSVDKLDHEFIIEKIIPVSRKLIFSYFSTNVSEHFDHIIMENLLVNYGFAFTKKFIEHLYVLFQTSNKPETLNPK